MSLCKIQGLLSQVFNFCDTERFREWKKTKVKRFHSKDQPIFSLEPWFGKFLFLIFPMSNTWSLRFSFQQAQLIRPSFKYVMWHSLTRAESCLKLPEGLTWQYIKLGYTCGCSMLWILKSEICEKAISKSFENVGSVQYFYD